MRLATISLALLIGCMMARAQDALPQPVQITKGPRVENVTSTTVIIAWSTNVNASTVIHYGPDVQHLSETAEEPWGGLTHRVVVRDLSPATTYYFQAESSQGQGTGTKALSDVMSFATKAGASLPQAAYAGASNATDAAQIVAGPIVQNVTGTSAQVWWETDRPADTILKYGSTADNLSEIQQKPWGDQTHRVEITGLEPGRAYFIAVAAPDHRLLAESSFRTSAAQSPLGITNGPVIEFLGNNSAVIAWSTNAASTSKVRYGETPSGLDQSAAENGAQTTHRVHLQHLKANTRYFFQVESTDADRHTVESSAAPFRTAATAEQALRFAPR